MKNIKIRETEQGFVQCDPTDAIKKGELFPARFNDYFEYADALFFCWNDELNHGQLPSPCAKVEKIDTTVRLTIFNPTHWSAFCRKYLEDIERLSLPMCPIFASLISKKSGAEAVDRVSALQAQSVWSGSSSSSSGANLAPAPYQ